MCEEEKNVAASYGPWPNLKELEDVVVVSLPLGADDGAPSTGTSGSDACSSHGVEETDLAR